MANISLAMQRFLWLIYRAFGLACLLGALHHLSVAMQLDALYMSREAQIPYYLICLALAAGTLFLLPSTTPHRIARIRSGLSGMIAVGVLITLSVLLIMSFSDALRVPDVARFADYAALSRDLVLLLAVAGCASIAWLGLTAERGARKRVPVMEEAAQDLALARAMRNARG